MVKEEKKSTSGGEKPIFLDRRFKSFENLLERLEDIPYHYTGEKISKETASFAELVSICATMAEDKEYEGKFIVRKDSILIKLENESNDEGDAFEEITFDEMENILTFERIKGKVRGMILRRLDKYQPQGIV